MTESPSTPQVGSRATPQAGIAQAVGDLSEQTRNLVRHEITAAQREMLAKAKRSAPALALAAASATSGLLAAASAYRLSLRILEKRLSPAAAAFIATLGYGAAAAGGGLIAARQIRQLPPLFPTGTVRQASQSVAEAAGEAAGKASAGA